MPVKHLNSSDKPIYILKSHPKNQNQLKIKNQLKLKYTFS